MDVRIYYEDTDAAGVVYHASYLKFFERARTEYFRERGLGVAELATAGFVFPVIRMEIDFKASALHDELLSIITRPERIGGASFVVRQQAVRPSDGRVLVEAQVTLACISPERRARRLPDEVRRVLEEGVTQGQ
ncbi:YbgC/FadM family acyl-CoA thioesterase [Oryzomonas japonica]|uniref:YbgC/FadM family acyl-CoA thioesterase n=1 Tax=Oryzomonas japonica TaxID=2603858 RepID=A0A7J4ZUS0_9BACT|nr:YbgC/FadM family acyl-CoA thioesterase [Oryzomonas japonica]KAB0667161.1 YbgC/FadM family acyl-CoA thioesterase [Oryzomonas japonica]